MPSVIGLGIPIFYGRKAVSYEEDVSSGKARVLAASGEVFAGDVVVAAEGIGTKSHEFVTGSPVPFVDSGYAIMRGAFNPGFIEPNSKGAELLLEPGQTPEVRTYVGLVVLTTDQRKRFLIRETAKICILLRFSPTIR